MKNALLNIVVIAAVLSPAVAWAQSAKEKPTTATYITKDEIDQLSKSEQGKAVVDQNTKVIDLGYENFTVGVIHRASTRNPPPAPAANAAAAAAPVESCGRQMATLPPGGTPGGIVHDFQTEGYYIISGGGVAFTDGYIVNGSHGNQNNNPGGPNGPTCSGVAYGVRKMEVKTGDIIIVPPGVVHGWLDIPDHVDYLSFRPSQNVLGVGWVNPVIQNTK
jgi:hypothetical protein